MYVTRKSMRNILGHILLCLILALRFGFVTTAFPQGDDYDKALDKYARICDRCVDLRARSESGQSVRMEELKSLLAELSSLRKTLSNASGKMSEEQTERFEAIKARYLRGMKAFEKPDRPAFSTIPKIVPVTEPAEVTYRTHYSKSLRHFGKLSAPQAQRPEVESRRLNAPRQLSSSNESLSKPFRLTVLADAGIFPTPSYGAMVVATRNGIGAYANYMSDFRKNEYSYTCTSGGDTEYGRIWATGKSRVSRTVATVGLAMFTSQRLGFHAGAGVTSYTRCWEDVSGQWAKVEDKSFKSLAADTGIFLTFNSLILSLGVTSDFSGHVDVRFGLGLSF